MPFRYAEQWRGILHSRSFNAITPLTRLTNVRAGRANQLTAIQQTSSQNQEKRVPFYKQKNLWATVFTALALISALAYFLIQWRYQDWTAQKDFLEYCRSLLESNATSTKSCDQALTLPLPPPPFSRRVAKRTLQSAERQQSEVDTLPVAVGLILLTVALLAFLFKRKHAKSALSPLHFTQCQEEKTTNAQRTNIRRRGNTKHAMNRQWHPATPSTDQMKKSGRHHGYNPVPLNTPRSPLSPITLHYLIRDYYFHENAAEVCYYEEVQRAEEERLSREARFAEEIRNIEEEWGEEWATIYGQVKILTEMLGPD